MSQLPTLTPEATRGNIDAFLRGSANLQQVPSVLHMDFKVIVEINRVSEYLTLLQKLIDYSIPKARRKNSRPTEQIKHIDNVPRLTNQADEFRMYLKQQNVHFVDPTAHEPLLKRAKTTKMVINQAQTQQSILSYYDPIFDVPFEDIRDLNRVHEYETLLHRFLEHSNTIRTAEHEAIRRRLLARLEAFYAYFGHLPIINHTASAEPTPPRFGSPLNVSGLFPSPQHAFSPQHASSPQPFSGFLSSPQPFSGFLSSPQPFSGFLSSPQPFSGFPSSPQHVSSPQHAYGFGQSSPLQAFEFGSPLRASAFGLDNLTPHAFDVGQPLRWGSP